MTELKSAKHRKPDPSPKESRELASLAGMLNASAGVIAPKEKLPGAAVIKETPAVKSEPTRESLPVSSPAVAPVPVTLNKIAFTGRLMSGKDFTAEQAGLKVFSIAQPLYALQKLFFGSDDKALPGAREFLQAAGQIGRNEISATHPLSIERANFIALVREQANRLPDDFLVDWQAYGRHADLWLDAMLLRVQKYLAENPGARVAVTNCRFNNELSRLTASGFVHFHCLASAATWTARLKQVGLAPESPATKDVSEYLAASLDSSVTKQLSTARTGPKLRCVWSDERVPPPSNRLLSIPEFCAMFKT